MMCLGKKAHQADFQNKITNIKTILNEKVYTNKKRGQPSEAGVCSDGGFFLLRVQVLPQADQKLNRQLKISKIQVSYSELELGGLIFHTLVFLVSVQKNIIIIL